MRTFGAGPKARFLTVAVAAAMGLGIAASSADASPPAGNGKPTTLTALLEDVSLVAPEQRRNAADAFVVATIGANMEDVIATATPALDDLRAEQRYYALVGLGAAGLASTENGEYLMDIAYTLVYSLADEDATVRTAAAATLSAIQPAPPEWAADSLINLLDDPEPRVASAAMRALERIAANAAGLDAAYSVFASSNPGNRSRAARLVGAYGAETDDVDATWELVVALRDPDAGVRWQAASALGDMGKTALVAIRDLWAVSRDSTEQPAVRRAAATSINSILAR